MALDSPEHISLDAIDPQIHEAFGGPNKKVDIVPPALRHMLFKGAPSLIPDDNFHQTGLAGFYRYVEAHFDISEADLPETVENTLPNRAAIHIGLAGLEEGINFYFNRAKGRPDLPMRWWCKYFDNPMRYVQNAKEVKGVDKAAQLQIMGVQMDNLEANLAELHRLYFGMKRHDGTDSFGYANAGEKTDLLKRLRDLKTQAKHDELHDQWTQLGGESQAFEEKWSTWISTLKKWINKFSAIEANDNPKAQGEASLDAFTKAWRLSNTVESQIEILLSHIDAYSQEISRLMSQAPEREQPAKPTVDSLRGKLKAALELTVKSGLMNDPEGKMDMSRFEVKIKDPSGFERASVSNGVFTFYVDVDTPKSRWAKTAQDRQVALCAHELTHEWHDAVVIKSDAIESDLLVVSVKEAAGVTMDNYTAVKQSTGDIYETIAHLSAAKGRLTYKLASLYFHSERKTREETIQFLQQTTEGSERYAQSIFDDISTSPGSVAANYGLYQLVLDHYLKKTDTTVVEAVERTIGDTHLCIPFQFQTQEYAKTGWTTLSYSTPSLVRWSQAQHPSPAL